MKGRIVYYVARFTFDGQCMSIRVFENEENAINTVKRIAERLGEKIIDEDYNEAIGCRKIVLDSRCLYEIRETLIE